MRTLTHVVVWFVVVFVATGAFVVRLTVNTVNTRFKWITVIVNDCFDTHPSLYSYNAYANTCTYIVHTYVCKYFIYTHIPTYVFAFHLLFGPNGFS